MRTQDGPPALGDTLNDVLAVASEVFQRPVPATANFFDLGGDSVLAVEFMMRFEELRGIQPDMDALLTAPDLASFAHGLAGGDGAARPDAPASED
jgi:acyl carrier protein